VEAVEITYDPNIVAYEDLVTLFWQQIDPTDAGGQFHDRGTSYQTAIFYVNEQQKEIAEKSKAELEASDKFKKPIVTPILPAKPFYKAEEEHQHYYKKNQFHYNIYKKGSARQQFIGAHWHPHVDSRARKAPLSEHAYCVPQERSTEPPLQQRYWSHDDPGIYVDVVAVVGLLPSIDEFAADGEWGGFTKLIDRK